MVSRIMYTVISQFIKEHRNEMSLKSITFAIDDSDFYYDFYQEWNKMIPTPNENDGDLHGIILNYYFSRLRANYLSLDTFQLKIDLNRMNGSVVSDLNQGMFGN